ncbi:MAG: hypothetical protein QM486_03375 [Flavobacteriaceae bacterium]
MRNTKKIDIERLELAFKRLKLLLIIMTIIELSYVLVNSTDQLEVIKFIFQNNIDKMLWVLHLLLVGVFIGFIWKKFPANKKSKWNNTLMILFLGVIGMWLWFPNKKELEKLMNEG